MPPCGHAFIFHLCRKIATIANGSVVTPHRDSQAGKTGVVDLLDSLFR